jgi:3-oxoacyl-[acyl-carrier-protein] synthase II
MASDYPVLTAAGVVTAAGDSSEALYASLSANGSPAVRRIDGFDPRRYVDRRGMKHMSRGSQLACSAAAGVARTLGDVDGKAVGVVYGSAWGCLNTIVRFERAAHVDGPRFVDPMLFTETVANVPAGQVSIVFGWSALNATVSAGTASGLEAIRLAVDLLADGRAAIVVAGGGDEANPHVNGTLARGAPGEGACFVSVESEAHARQRRALPLARLRGGAGCFAGSGADAGARCRRELGRLLDRAGLGPADVDLLVAPGAIAHDSSDPGLSAARALMPHARCWSPMPGLGECWAANGPAALTATVEAMRRRALPGEEPASARTSLARAIVLESSATGHFAALAVERGES